MGFKSYNLEEIKKALNLNNSNNNRRYNWANLPEKGESFKIRFLPPVGNMSLPFVKLVKHYQVPNSDAEGTTHINCLKTWDMECPVCKKLSELERKFGEDLVRRHFATMRGLFNVLIKDSDKYKEGTPYIISLPKSALVWFIQTIGDNEIGDITDPKTGFWVKVTRKENNQLDFQIIPKPCTIGTDEEIERIANECVDLTTLVKQPDDEYYQKLIKIAEKIEEQVKRKVGLLDTPNADTQKTEIIASSIDEAVNITTESANKVQSSMKTNSTQMVNKPDDAPECFGNYKEGSSRCMICIYELECRQASGV